MLTIISNFKFQISNSSRGFTLIELIITIAILAVLSVAIFTTLNPIEQIQKGQDTRRKSDLSQLRDALEAYYQDFGRYPATTAEYKIFSNEGGTGTEKDWGENWSPYMQTIPSDSSGRRYMYNVSTDGHGQSYWIYASLERDQKDIQVCANQNTVKDDGQTCTNVPDAVFCGVSNQICNYGVSSSNVSL